MTKPSQVKITECPRDAMQGLQTFIPTEQKIAYLNTLLKVGFDILDFGSFVSPKAIPQLKDTVEVLKNLNLADSKTRLLAIIGNLKGGQIGAQFDEVTYLGYPYSITETFLKLNINSTFEKSQNTISELLEICDRTNKELMVYISMGFGNPYNEEWHIDQVEEHTRILQKLGVHHINLSDTIGSGNVDTISSVFEKIPPMFPDVNFGLHMHTVLEGWYEKVDAAYKNGCRHFDSVINGLGGCPMAKYKLVGNLNTIHLIEYFNRNKIVTNIDEEALDKAVQDAFSTFLTAF
jgi:hydroxymethylglutaryl-CoA lyase